MRLYKNLVSVLLLLVLVSCKTVKPAADANKRIAFIADAHLQDIFGTFQDNDYKGIPNPLTGEYATIRTMSSQLHSTRIYNENYFAFLEALNDIVRRGIKLVALPGDFSDDGQAVHVRGLKRILDQYTQKYGMSFFVTTGNHDVVKPFAQDATKTDFLGKGGKEQIISSSGAKLPVGKDDLAPIITADIKNWGYKEMTQEMADFGFFPQQKYLYWETPFSNYAYENYTFDKALEASLLANRSYAIKNTKLSLPDVSYLVEPVQGVWLLALDANAYVPVEKLSGLDENPNDFSSASVGYNNVLLYKNHLVHWVKKISAEAKQKGKILIAFSHYPMVDFNDDASAEMKTLFGANKMQLQRVPQEEVAQAFADAGLQIHFGGHMHINDTGVRTTELGNTLFNIQTPSLAAYKPGYKILSIHSNTEVEVETVVVKSVPRFDSLFPFYEEEYAHLKEQKSKNIWNKDILKVKDYEAFTSMHLNELVRLRFLPEDFSAAFLNSIQKLTAKDLLLLNNSEIQLSKELSNRNLKLQDFELWSGSDMIFDFYRLKNADELALADISSKRVKEYQLICEQLEKSTNKEFVLWAKIFQKMMSGQASDHFKINLKNHEIKRINP